MSIQELIPKYRSNSEAQKILDALLLHEELLMWHKEHECPISFYIGQHDTALVDKILQELGYSNLSSISRPVGRNVFSTLVLTSR